MFHFSLKIGFLAAITGLLYSSVAHAEPQTYFDTAASIEAPINSGRFGAAMDCSVGSETGGTSYIAIGAPDANSGAGAVYIYEAGASPTLVQTINGTGSYNFGTSVAFVNDFTGDNRQDLVVGELNSGLNIYRSTGSAPPFANCGQSSQGSGTDGFAKTMASRRAWGTTPVRLFVGAPDMDQIYGYNFDYSGGICGTLGGLGFDLQGTLGTGFGTAISTMSADFDGDSEPEIVVGGPISNFGGVTVADSNSDFRIAANVGESRYGKGVGTYWLSPYIAYSHRDAISGSGYVTIQDTNYGSPTSCTASSTGDATDFGKALRNLYTTPFSTLIPGTDSTFAGYRAEGSTGGSVSIFAILGGSCISEYQYNNCQSDPNQEQGSVLSGSRECQAVLGGSPKSLLLVGSPGLSSNKGRIDIVAENSDHSSPISCSGGGGGGGLPVSPGTGNLPAPSVTTSGKSATITAPSVTPTLTASQRKKALALLMKRGLSKKKANAALNNLTVTYVFTVKASSATSSEASAQASSITRRSKRNNITLNNLAPGAKAATYRIEISTRKPPVVLGQTKNSSATRFTIGTGH